MIDAETVHEPNREEEDEDEDENGDSDRDRGGMMENWPCVLCEGRAAGHYVLVDEHGTDAGVLCTLCTNRLEKREGADDWSGCLLKSDCGNEPVYSIVNYNYYAPGSRSIDAITGRVLCEECYSTT